MKPDRYQDKKKEIQVFGPSLLTLCTIERTFIIDLFTLGSKQATADMLDQRLTWAFQMLPVYFVSFSIPTLVNYFREFLPSFGFL